MNKLKMIVVFFSIQSLFFNSMILSKIDYKKEINQLLAEIKKSKPFHLKEDCWEFMASQVDPVGAILEFGVYRGWSINFLSSKLPKSIFFGFDSFKGLPEKWRDGFKVGAFMVSNFHRLKFNQNVIIIPGLFQETLESFLKIIYLPRVTIIHIDSDIYSAANYVLTTLKDLIVTQKPYLLFDEIYNYPGFEENEMKAFLEFIYETGLNYEVVAHTKRSKQAGCGQQALIKLK